MKDKFTASSAFDKYKARMVAGGNRQDKSLYDDLRSPTIATSHVLTIVKTSDFAGAYLMPEMTDSYVPVYMVIDADMAKLLCQLDPSYKDFLSKKGEV